MITISLEKLAGEPLKIWDVVASITERL